MKFDNNFALIVNGFDIKIKMIRSYFFYFLISAILYGFSIYVESKTLADISIFVFILSLIFCFIVRVIFNKNIKTKIMRLSKSLSLDWKLSYLIGRANNCFVLYDPNNQKYFFINPYKNIYLEKDKFFIKSIELETKVEITSENKKKFLDNNYTSKQKTKETYFLELHTVDFDIPRIVISINSKNNAKDWMSKLTYS